MQPSTPRAQVSHSRKRSGTLSSLLSSPPPLQYGSSKTLTLWVDDSANCPDVALNLDCWPGAAVGDLVRVTLAHKPDGSRGILFQVAPLDTLKPQTPGGILRNPDVTRREPYVAQITMAKDMVAAFKTFSQRCEVTLRKVERSTVEADYLEIYFKDLYLGRGDMWRLSMFLENKCVYVDQKLTFAGCISSTVKKIYIKGKSAPSAFVSSKTKLIFRSLSAKSTIFIQVCSELWEFADDGERYYEKIVHSFLPALFDHWKETGTTHVVTIVLISRVFYLPTELEYAAGPLRQDDQDNWYKDFYKVVVDLELVKDWKHVLVSLKQSFWDFQRDILFTHHYHQPSNADLVDGKPPARLVGRLSFAHEGPILEALNLGLNPTEKHYIDRSFSLTGSGTTLITPGTAHFRVSKTLLRLTTARLLDQGFTLDILCLTKQPLHRTPLFCYKGEEPVLKSERELRSGSTEMDPLWVKDDPEGNKEKKLFWWEPFWADISFWDQQRDMPFREDRFVPRARMHEIQMLGLLEHDISSTISIPYLEDAWDTSNPDPNDARKSMCEAYDNEVFTSPAKLPPRPSITHSNTSSSGGTFTPTQRSETDKGRITQKLDSPRPSTSTKPLVFPLSESPIAEEKPTPLPTISTFTIADQEKIPTRSPSPSQTSIRSSSSQRKHVSRQKSTGGVGSWLLSSFRAAPSQPEASTVSIIRKDMDKAKIDSLSNALGSQTSSSPSQAERQKPEASASRAIPARKAQRNLQDDDERDTSIISARYSQSRISPLSSSPREDSLLISRRQSTLSSRPDPSKISSTLAPSIVTLARRWQHVFPQPTFQHTIKWISMSTPACLPLTVELFPTQAQLDSQYRVNEYVILLGEIRPSLVVWNNLPYEEWTLLVLRKMAALRLAQGFQFIIDPFQSPSSSTHSSTYPISRNSFVYDIVPKGASDILKSTAYPVFLSTSDQIHKISYDSVEQSIKVTRWLRQSSYSTEDSKTPPFQYECLVWPNLGDGYTEAFTSFGTPDQSTYAWNRLDMMVAGLHHDLPEELHYWRTRFLVIPSESSPSMMSSSSGEPLNEEEVRLLGIDRLAELFGKARWVPYGEKADASPPPRFLATSLDPSASVLDESLMMQLDEIHATGPLRKKQDSKRVLEESTLSSIAKAMREDDGVGIKDRQWHHVTYKDVFTGYDFVSWLIREFKDVSTREQGAQWGAKLQEQGLFEHCRGEHGFLDGHFFYRLTGEYAAQFRASTSKWFRSVSTAPSKSTMDELRVPGDPINISSSITASPSNASLSAYTTKKLKRRLLLSQTMIIDVDPTKRSDQAELVVLHHDIVQNPGTAFHFELHWIGATARCIDDMIQSWNRAVERYGLKIVEGYVNPILEVTKRNVFQSCFPIRLALPPPIIPDLDKRLPDTNPSLFFEYSILRKCGYILDIEAENRYSEQVDVFYSYRRASFKHSQFVHRTGLAFVQVIGGTEGFRWLTNRLLATSNIHSVGGRSKQGVHETAHSIRLQLLDFCSDQQRLSELYDSIVSSLPVVDQ